MPEHNEGLYAVPQILTNRADGFLNLCHALKEFGYQEINLNLGCPSRTVVSKNKGSGFLALLDELDRFLDQIFSKADVKLSIKTRIGKENPDEFGRLLEIYNQYPLEELIIHPRVQTDYYKNTPRMDVYREARKESRHPLCYNGDLFTGDRIRKFQEEFPEEDRVMIGRGIIINPGLIHDLCGKAGNDAAGGTGAKERFCKFHELLLQRYLERDMGDANVLCKMKELWFYQIQMFPDSERYAKKLKKVRKMSEYRQIVNELTR
jgi:tRNA-dihydrouridine synthase